MFHPKVCTALVAAICLTTLRIAAAGPLQGDFDANFSRDDFKVTRQADPIASPEEDGPPAPPALPAPPDPMRPARVKMVLGGVFIVGGLLHEVAALLCVVVYGGNTLFNNLGDYNPENPTDYELERAKTAQDALSAAQTLAIVGAIAMVPGATLMIWGAIDYSLRKTAIARKDLASARRRTGPVFRPTLVLSADTVGLGLSMSL